VRYRGFLFATLVVCLSACTTVTITPGGRSRLIGEPSYQDSKPFFLGGLIGEHHVDVMAICGGKEPAQMQSQQTFADALVTIVTLTIYTPQTTKVWCNKA
jgi:Bor protein